jgi:hypothetical protein
VRTRKIAAVGALAALGFAIGVAPRAEAAFIATIEQIGSNVVVTGSGSLDLTGLTFLDTGGTTSGIDPAASVLSIGPAGSVPTDVYRGSINGPSNFGSGGIAQPSSSGSGDRAGLQLDFGVFVAQGYVSGDALSDTSTYDNATFSSLGLTSGTYVWTWGSGADADSFTLEIGVPEPASLALLGTGVVGLGLKRRRRLAA